MNQFGGIVLVLLLLTNVLLVSKSQSKTVKKNENSKHQAVKETPRPTAKPTLAPSLRPTFAPTFRPSDPPLPRPVASRKRNRSTEGGNSSGWRSFLLWLTIAGIIAIAFLYFRQNYGDDERFSAGIALNPMRRGDRGGAVAGGYAPV